MHHTVMMAASSPVASSTDLFRRLSWQSTVPLEIRLAENEPGAGSGADRYYMYPPRHAYLPLLIPEIRENLVEIALDDQQLAETNEAEWWFEEDPAGTEGFASQGPCRWHWPLDLIHLNSLLTSPAASPSSSLTPSAPGPSKPSFKPLRLLLHLSSPPTDKLMLPNTVEVCKAQFMNQLREADFVRWRNTSRVTNMRRPDLDAGWEGIVHDDYDMYMRMATRLIPLPHAAPPSTTATSRPASTDPGGKIAESSYSVRALPIKLYLPDGAPVIQEVVPPIGADSQPTTILSFLHLHLPLLFPPSSKIPYPMALPIAQGVEIPPEAELAWLSASMCGADGWLRIGIRLISDT